MMRVRPYDHLAALLAEDQIAPWQYESEVKRLLRWDCPKVLWVARGESVFMWAPMPSRRRPKKARRVRVRSWRRPERRLPLRDLRAA